MTVHKDQGRTITKVILALSKRPSHCLQMRYQSIFVAMSRIRQSDNIHLLLHEKSGYDELTYIYGLSPPDDIKHFFAGFVKKKNIYVWDRTKTFESKFGKQYNILYI